MSTREKNAVIKGVMIVVISSIIMAAGSSYIQFRIYGYQATQNKNDIKSLKMDHAGFVKTDEHNRTYKIVIDNQMKLDDRITKVEEENRDNYKEIIQHLFDIKDVIQELHAE